MKRVVKLMPGLLLVIALAVAQPLTQAALPAVLMNSWVLNVGGSLAGGLIFAGGRWVFNGTTQRRTGTLKAEPSLSVGTNTGEVVHWYENKVVGRSTYNVTDERKLGQYDIKVAWIVWDDSKAKYGVRQTDDYFGGAFKTSFSEYMTSGKDSDGYVGEGYFLKQGNSKKIECDHWLRSSAKGDRRLANHGSFKYDATV